MTKLFSLLFSLLFIASIAARAEIAFVAEQEKDGNEVVLSIVAKKISGPTVALGGADIPFNVDGTVLDIANAYIDYSVPRFFDNTSKANSYNPLTIHHGKLLTVRVNNKIGGNGNGVLIDEVPKSIATVRIPILNECGTSVITWETTWGAVNEFATDQWPHDIKDQVKFEMANSKLQLFPTPYAPVIGNLDSDTVCAGSPARLYTHNPENFTVIWEKDGDIVQIGSDTMFNVNASGTYRVGFSSCSVDEFSDALHVEVLEEPIKPTITENQGTLVSSADKGNQWFLNGNVLTGSIGKTLVPSQSGNYSVEVSNQCGETLSDPYSYIINALGQGVVATRVGAYPNPYFGSSNVYLDLIKDSDVLIEVYDLRGVKVREMENNHLFSGAYEWKFETGDLGLASGSYVLKIFADGRVYTTTLIEASK